ncbi:MAG: 50S ribosomal protein L13 [Alphaproteobacteria bacterium]|nr:50S ribosomal protein L13 [Alphaproteobacteria bacterium]
MRTYSARPSEVTHKWYVIDADGVVLGRLATIIAMRIRGKHKAMYTPHIDCGDHIIVINAEKVRLTGRKLEQKVYHKHTGYPGGIKETKAGEIVKGRFPERVIKKAVERMLPKDSPLARDQLRHLKVYSGPAHPHEAQGPVVLDVAKMNAKNRRSARKN